MIVEESSSPGTKPQELPELDGEAYVFANAHGSMEEFDMVAVFPTFLLRGDWAILFDRNTE
jgi:hypothetical protein